MKSAFMQYAPESAEAMKIRMILFNQMKSNQIYPDQCPDKALVTDIFKMLDR